MDEEMKMAIKAYDEFTAVIDRFSKKMETVEQAENAVAQSTNEVNRAVQVFADTIQKTGPPTEQLTRKTKDKAAADKEAQAAARAHAEELKAKAKAEKEATKATEEHKQKVDGLLQGLGALGILAAVKQGFQEVTRAGSEMSKELSIQVGLTGQARDATLDFLMGLENQRKGVTELAAGLNELARAGFTGPDSMKALPELATFATAAMGDLEKSMAPVVTILKVFQKDVSTTGEITDVLTEAANKSALGFDDFQLALAMSAGVAKMSGMEYQELIAVLSVMRDAGLGASDGGTSLKSALMALMNPSTEATKLMKELGIQVYDSNGKMKSWADIVGNVEQALAPLNEQSKNLALTTIFGSDGVRAMALSMGRGSDYIRGMTADLKDSRGATAELAHEMGNDFNGALQRTQANLEKMKVTVFEDLNNGTMGLLGAVDTLIVGFNSLDGKTRGVVEVLVGGAGLTAAVAAVALLVRSTLIPIFESMIAMMVKAGIVAATTGTTIQAAFGWVGLVAAALVAVGTAIIGYTGAAAKAREETERKNKSLVDLAGQYDSLQQVMDDAGRSEEERSQASEKQKRVIEQLGEAFPELVTQWDSHGMAVELDTKRLRENTEAAQENMRVQAQTAMEKARVALETNQRNLGTFLADKAKNREQAIKAFQADPAWVGQSQEYKDWAFKDFMNRFDRKTAEQEQELRKAVALASSEFAKAVSALYGDLPNDGTIGPPANLRPILPPGDKTLTTDPDAAEKARAAAIRDQMELLRHLVVIDDERVDTAAEQLQWLERIRDTLGSTRELDEAIYELQKGIAREPLQQQLALFARRQQLGEMTARQEQLFYEELLANAEQYKLTVQEIGEYQVRAAVAKKAADKEAFADLLATAQYNIDLTDASTAQQLSLMKTLRDSYREGSEERKKLDLEVHRLEQRNQAEVHRAALDQIEFDAVMNRWSEEQKLQALRDYLAKATDLTVEQKRDLQVRIANMEQSQEATHQNNLIELYRQGLETQRRIKERILRDEHRTEENDLLAEIEEERKHYEDLLSPLREQLATMQAQTKELERQNRLLDLQKSLQKKDAEIADAKAIRNRVVIESGGPLGFTIRRTYDEARVRELEEERAGIQEQIEDEKARQAREKAEEELSEKIGRLEKERDAKLKAKDKELQDMRNAHQNELTELNTYWDDRMTNQNIQMELEKTGWKTHYADVLLETQNWVRDMNKSWGDLQRPAIDNGKALSEQLGGTIPIPPPAGTTSNSGAGQQGAKSVTVENNFFGNNHFDGVEGVEKAAEALGQGFKTGLRV